jgi:hypothetical protein
LLFPLASEPCTAIWACRFFVKGRDTIVDMTAKHPSWLLLITNLPGHNPTLRMRLWRALKAGGAGPLRDGVYVLPDSGPAREVFEEHAKDIKEGGGVAYVLHLETSSREQLDTFRGLFDRTAEYAEVAAQLNVLVGEMAKLTEVEGRQRLTAIGREVHAIVERDYFPGKAREQMESALTDAQAALDARFSPDEPRPGSHKIQRLDAKDYRARTWATRERLWIDRVASAWLIRRFIDPKARFVWLKRVKDCPKRAVGFDFDGAQFTHVDAKVTFEVLVASFGLESDTGLGRLGALVHHLDVGGIPTADGAGFATIMTGARALHTDDAALLEAMTPVIDSLYAAYSVPLSKA